MDRREYLFAMLAEESAEVAKQSIKIMRFGPDEVQPGQHKTNTERLQGEVNDLMAAIEMLQAEGADLQFNVNAIDRKKKKVEKYMRYSIECGCLNLPEDV